MNAVVQEQTAPDAVNEAKRERLIKTVYDYAKGTFVHTSDGDASFKVEGDVTKLPQPMLYMLAAQMLAIKSRNAALKAEKDEGPDATDPQEAANDLIEQYVKGEVDITKGEAAPRVGTQALLAQVLVDLGKTYIKDQFGNKHAFTDLESAKVAVTTLYSATQPNDAKITGRMLFAAICKLPEIKTALDAKRKKPAASKAQKAVEIG